MAWKIKFHKNALKFLKNLEDKRQNQIKKRLNELLTYLDKGVFPYNRLDIKRMRGKWKDSFRMRIGDIRIIFTLDKENKVVWVYNAHFRGKIY